MGKRKLRIVQKAKKEKPEERWFALPSGLTVRARRVRLENLIAVGEIPLPLARAAAKACASGPPDLRHAPLLGMVFSKVARYAIVHPPVSERPSDESIAVDELTFADRLRLFEWAVGIREIREVEDER